MNDDNIKKLHALAVRVASLNRDAVDDLLISHADLERQLAQARRERDNAISDWRQADSDTVRALHERNEARKQRDALAEIAGELIAMIRVNVMRDTFREATIEQVDAHLEPWIKRIHAVKESTPEQP